MSAGRIIGIDLGTTNSCVALLEGDDVKIIANGEGNRTTPSVVAFLEGERLVGQIAKRQALTNPAQTVYAAKRLIGRKFNDPAVQSLGKLVSYEIVAAPNGDAWIRIGDKVVSPSEIGSCILAKLKEAAEAYVGEPIERAVITVPAYFDDAQRQATKDAGQIAGLTVERIINEPTAATLAYGLDRFDSETDAPRKVVVYDLGGGTFDVSVLELRAGAFEVLATAGDTFLGGEDFDNRIVDWAAEQFLAEHSIDLRTDKLSRQRLKEAAEKAKHELSYAIETEISLPFIAAKSGAPLHMSLTMERSTLEKICRDLVERTLEPCRQALEQAELEQEQIDELVLVGGQTRMPLVRDLARAFFGRDPNIGVDPDEVVAVGAAIQGAIIDGTVEDMVLLDVVPLHIGVETAGGVFTPIIVKGTTIPTRKSEVFSTSIDNQPVVPVHVLQGLREMAEDCRSLARLQLTDIPPAPRGVPQVCVTFDIDCDGILSVSAEDLASGRTAAMTVQPASGLTSAYLEQLTEEAQASRLEDTIRRELADLRNRASTLMYTCERSLETYANDLSAEIHDEISTDLENLREALEHSGDPGAVREALVTLETSSHQIYEAMLARSQDGDGRGVA
jgi:molecular chaperone DnaK